MGLSIPRAPDRPDPLRPFRATQDLSVIPASIVTNSFCGSISTITLSTKTARRLSQ
jgi:hypothetical protein